MADNGREAIITMLLIETVRRLTKNGKNPIHITNGQIERNFESGYEVDYADSDSGKFVLKLTKGEEVVLETEVAFTPEEGSEDESVSS